MRSNAAARAASLKTLQDAGYGAEQATRLLPLLVAYRYLSLEYLAQFDPALNMFTEPSAPKA